MLNNNRQNTYKVSISFVNLRNEVRGRISLTAFQISNNKILNLSKKIKGQISSFLLSSSEAILNHYRITRPYVIMSPLDLVFNVYSSCGY